MVLYHGPQVGLASVSPARAARDVETAGVSMARTDNDTWGPDTSVGTTATLVATARALAHRAGLINDPFAEPLVSAVGRDFFTKVAALAEEEGHHPDLHLEGYRHLKIVLWTQRNLLAARGLYRATGFRKTGEERHESFGAKLVAPPLAIVMFRHENSRQQNL